MAPKQNLKHEHPAFFPVTISVAHLTAALSDKTRRHQTTEGSRGITVPYAPARRGTKDYQPQTTMRSARVAHHVSKAGAKPLQCIRTQDDTALTELWLRAGHTSIIRPLCPHHQSFCHPKAPGLYLPDCSLPHRRPKRLSGQYANQYALKAFKSILEKCAQAYILRQ